MVIDPLHAATVATRRFGLGARPGEVEACGRDPRGAVLSQLDPAAARLEGPQLASSAAIYRELWAFVAEQKRKRGLPAKPGGATGPDMATMRPATAMREGEAAPMAARGAASDTPAMPPFRTRFLADATARLDRQITTSTPFVERLVNFWSNHFCVSAAKGPLLRASAGAYEREAIRPHVLGRFEDMLMASAHHPAMLFYLDNNVSSGPQSYFGQRRSRGLNENLGREILELHTLGVDGGYTQADVTAFATALTGWSVVDATAKRGEPGTFLFNPARHQPGTVRILGRNYAQPGVLQAEAALADFARHPATGRHIARKLVRHFVGDAAPPGLAERLARVFANTGGDLRAVTRALVEADEAWDAPAAKILSPWDLLVAMGRMLDTRFDVREANRLLGLFGQPLWNVPFPAGWPDDDEAWAAPDSLLELLDAATDIGRRHVGDRDVLELADATLGARLDGRTRDTVARADTRANAFALLVLSPDFLRR